RVGRISDDDRSVGEGRTAVRAGRGTELDGADRPREQDGSLQSYRRDAFADGVRGRAREYERIHAPDAAGSAVQGAAAEVSRPGACDLDAAVRSAAIPPAGRLLSAHWEFGAGEHYRAGGESR